MLERRTFEGGITALVSPLFQSVGFLAAFTERTGGVSEGRYRSLNLALRGGDDPERAVENRRRVCDALGIASILCAHQVHGATVAEAGQEATGALLGPPVGTLGHADAIVTGNRSVALGVITADCVPVALASPTEGRLAVVHAGWRGMASGVLAAALGRFDDPRGVIGAIGPAVGPDHYEVGDDVAAAVGAATEGGAVSFRRAGRVRLHLAATAARILRERGVRAVEVAEECTACEEDRFFSHRRDGPTGRQALVAVRW